MKFVLIFCITIAMTHGWPWMIQPVFRGKVTVARSACIESTHLSSDHVESVGNFVYPDTEEVHRYMKCVFENLEIWESKNGFRTDKIDDILEGHEHQSEMMAKIDDCNERNQSPDPEARLVDALNCVLNGTMGDDIRDIIREARGDVTTEPPPPTTASDSCS